MKILIYGLGHIGGSLALGIKNIVKTHMRLLRLIKIKKR